MLVQHALRGSVAVWGGLLISVIQFPPGEGVRGPYPTQGGDGGELLVAALFVVLVLALFVVLSGILMGTFALLPRLAGAGEEATGCFGVLGFPAAGLLIWFYWELIAPYLHRGAEWTWIGILLLALAAFVAAILYGVARAFSRENRGETLGLLLMATSALGLDSLLHWGFWWLLLAEFGALVVFSTLFVVLFGATIERWRGSKDIARHG